MTITTPIKRHRNDSQIRLMHIVNCLALSGTEYNVIKLLNNLDRKQFSPSVIDLQPTLSDARAHVAKDIDVFELPKGEGFQPRLIVKMAKLFRQLKIDIIHSHNWTTFLYSVLAARLASVPLIIHGEHGRDTADYERNPKQLRMRKFLASICD
ncbi:MAG: glycosyltransferase, partial [bacterium]